MQVCNPRIKGLYSFPPLYTTQAWLVKPDCPSSEIAPGKESRLTSQAKNMLEQKGKQMRLHTFLLAALMLTILQTMSETHSLARLILNCIQLNNSGNQVEVFNNVYMCPLICVWLTMVIVRVLARAVTILYHSFVPNNSSASTWESMT